MATQDSWDPSPQSWQETARTRYDEDPEPQTWYERYARSVDMDGAFAAWLNMVDMVMDRWLIMDFSEFESYCDARDSYIAGMTPSSFVRQIIVPTMEHDFGCDFIGALVADRILRGSGRRGR